ncbi:MAG: hypothetical protein JXB47_20855 [Anaerolineae bacterium]|nr:hypothetical protein [Anaerolineae bacterium]
MAQQLTVTTGAHKAPSYSGDYMAAGRQAEEIVIAWLHDRPQVLGVDDFRALRVVQEYDVDVGIKTADGRTLLAEIKSDRHLGKTGNVLFELLRINHTCHTDHAGALGWSLRSPATWLLYYAPAAGQVWQCRFDSFRRVFQHYTHQVRTDSAEFLRRSRVVLTDRIKTTVNLLIPLERCALAGKPIFTVHTLDLAQVEATRRRLSGNDHAAGLPQEIEEPVVYTGVQTPLFEFE